MTDIWGSVHRDSAVRLLFGGPQQRRGARRQIQTRPRRSSRPSWVWETAQNDVLQRQAPRSSQGCLVTPVDTSTPAPPSLLLSHPARILRHALGLALSLAGPSGWVLLKATPNIFSPNPQPPRKALSTASSRTNHTQH